MSQHHLNEELRIRNDTGLRSRRSKWFFIISPVSNQNACLPFLKAWRLSFKIGYNPLPYELA